MSMIPRALIGEGRCAFWPEAGVLADSPQVDDQLDVNFLAMRRRNHRDLGAECDLELFGLCSWVTVPTVLSSDTTWRHSMFRLGG
jgi:hypothetical protein